MPALPLVSARLSKQKILCLNDLLDSYLCKTFYYFNIFSFFSDFITWLYQMRWFYTYHSFIASSTASDDVTNYVTHRIFSTDLLYSFAHFIFKIDEKCSLDDGF